jgi:site-specific recombinase XerD
VNSGVRYVSLHACRHSFISILQSQGVDLAVVSEIVGHSNPAVTLGHYTQAVRGGAEALAMLDKAYQGE